MLRILSGQIEQCESTKKLKRRICSNIIIHFVISGKGYYNGQLLTGGQGFITYKGDYQEYYPDAGDPWKYVWVNIAGEDNEQLLEKCMFPKESGVFRFSYFEKLQEICGAAFKMDFSHEQFLNSNKIYAEALCKVILSLNISESDADEEKCIRWVHQAKSYIRSNYHRSLKVEDVAAMLHIDRKYLRNLFVQYTGESTQQYIIRVRMQHAKEYLKRTDAGISTIANSVGYDDAMAFSRMFKKYVGVSPTEFRNQS